MTVAAGKERAGGGVVPVAVAVVSWNTRELLARCLHSLADDAARGTAEVWVVDNASADGSAQLVADSFPWVRLIASQTNLGFGSAVNAVAERTRSCWIAPANADIELRPGALEALLSEGRRHAGAGALAPRLVLPDGSTQHSVFPFPTIPFTLAFLLGATERSRLASSYWCLGPGFDPVRSREVWWAVGAFLLVRRQAWDEVGGFSPEQWMYAEDLDLGWRLHRAGWRTRYVPEALVCHAESAATSSAWGEQRHERWHAASYTWMVRRRGLVRARTVAAINIGAYMTRAALCAPAALAGSERARVAQRRWLDTARNHKIGMRATGRKASRPGREPARRPEKA